MDTLNINAILAEGPLSREFYEDGNIWNAFTETLFHQPHLNKKSICELMKIQLEFKDSIDRLKFNEIRTRQLGGYNWELCNMHLSQHDKIAACAYLFSQIMTVVDVGRYREGVYVPKPRPTKEDWLAQIRASAEQDRIKEEQRKRDIEGGLIVLPDPGRPYEVWVYTETKRLKRYKTARSREALAKTIEFAGLHPGGYQEYYCPGPTEKSRKLL